MSVPVANKLVLQISRAMYLSELCKRVTNALLVEKAPFCISEQDLVEQTDLTTLELVTALARLRKYGVVDWLYQDKNKVYYIMHMESEHE